MLRRALLTGIAVISGFMAGTSGAQVYSVTMSGKLAATLDQPGGGEGSASFLVLGSNPFFNSPFTYRSALGNFNLMTTSAGLSGNAITGYAVTSGTDYRSFDHKYLSFTYLPHVYGTGEAVFDPVNPPAKLPFFSDTSAAVGTIIGSLNNGNNTLPNLIVDTVNVNSVTLAGIDALPILSQPKYSYEMKEIAFKMTVAMEVASRTFAAIGTVAEGGKNLALSAASYLGRAIMAAEADLLKNEDLRSVNKALDTLDGLRAIKGISASSNQLSLLMTVGSMLADEGVDRWERIRKDPPDANYKEVFVADEKQVAVDRSQLSASDALLLSGTIQTLKNFANGLTGILHSAERFDGATAAGDENSRLVQYAAFQLYAQDALKDAATLADQLDAMQSRYGSMLGDWESLQGDFAEAVAQQCRAGPSTDEAAVFQSAGYTISYGDLAVCKTGYKNIAVPANAFGEAATQLRQATLTSAVPEPSTWMMLMVGLALVASGLRLRKASKPYKLAE